MGVVEEQGRADSPTDSDAVHAATSARGPRTIAIPTLQQVERRRFELLSVTFVLLFAFVAGAVLLSFVSDQTATSGWLGDALVVFRISLAVLAGVFALYVLEKERHLRKVTADLLNERVLAAALSNRLNEITFVAEARRLASPGGQLSEAAGCILQVALELLDADEGSMMLVDGDEFCVAAGTGHPGRFIGRRQSPTAGIAGYVARTRKPLLLDGTAQSDDFRDLIPRDDQGRILSSVCVPLTVRSELVGVLSLNVTSGPRRYNEYDARALQLFGDHAAVVVHYARETSFGPSLRDAWQEMEAVRADLVRPAPAVLPSLSEPSAETMIRRQTRKRILLADDEPGLLRATKADLERRGFEVLLASDGQTVLSRIEQEKPDILVLELVLPVLDGWEVLSVLQDVNDRPRIVCLTHKNGRRDLYKAWTLGADEFVAKPFSPDRLADVLESVGNRTPAEQTAHRQEALKELLGSS